MKTFLEIKQILIERLRENATEEFYSKHHMFVEVDAEYEENGILFFAKANAIVTEKVIHGDSIQPDETHIDVLFINIAINHYTE